MRSSFAIVVFASLALRVSANCIYGTHLHRRQETIEVSNFGYSGTQGPVNWASLSPENAMCTSGKTQSPIVLDDTISFASEAPKVVINSVEEAEFENLGTTIEVVVNGTTTFAGKDFNLAQFHLHTPSEHRINDEYFPLEMHMVHEAEDGSIAVIAVPFQLTEDGSTTELLTAVIENLADIETPGTATKTGALDFAELIDAVQTKPLFQYTGSLTTPPCAEGLTFLVLSEPLALNVATYNAIKKVVKFNARFIQNHLAQTNLLELASGTFEKVLKEKAVVLNGTATEPINNEESNKAAAHETTISSSAAHETTTSASAAHETTTSSSAAHETTISSSAAHETTTSTSAAHETTTSSSAAHETTISSSAAHETTTSSSAVHESTTSAPHEATTTATATTKSGSKQGTPTHSFDHSTTITLSAEQACTRYGICSAKFRRWF